MMSFRSYKATIVVVECSRFQNNNFWNDNIFIKLENCECFCFHCVLSAFEQDSLFQALCSFFRGIRSPPPQVRRCPHANVSEARNIVHATSFIVVGWRLNLRITKDSSGWLGSSYRI